MEYKNLLDIDSLIFDLDGTLWDSTEVVLKAWNYILKNDKEVNEEVTREMMQGIMGLQLPQIGEKLFPKLSEEKRMKLMEDCCSYECGLIKEEGGSLFSRLEETLGLLSNKYPLFIVSNCQCGYIEAFFAYHKLDKYFKDFEHPGNTGLSKGENIKLIVERNFLKKPVYVGDTQGDREAARKAHVPFIFAGYGFGKVTDYDYSIKEFGELADILSIERV